ncbi:MAG: N-acetylneuraminate synthase [Actinomycetia bacterium]|nr:N-acetylneuraminate synthase [Actinomycetes bacterium]
MFENFKIGSYHIGDGQPCFIIAEAGVNHNGDIATAERLIDEASRAGASAVKFQAFITEELITAEAPKANYQVETTGRPGSQYEMLKALELTEEQHRHLKATCERAGVMYLCTPYDHSSADMLERIGVQAYKIASTDTANIPFLRYLGAKGIPVILSTGMSTLGEVEEAVAALEASGAGGGIGILQCTSEYPAPLNEVNLRSIATLRQAFGYPVGFSDHTPGTLVSPWAVALGACMIEKHFTLDRAMPGPDHRASIEPDELVDLVVAVRNLESASGDGVKRPSPSEKANKQFMQRSLVTRADIPQGALITAADLSCKRPATGLPPRDFDRVVGRKAARALPSGHIITLVDVEWA